MNIFDLQATISLNADGFMSGVQNAQTAFGGLGDKISAGTVALGTALGNMATKAAGAVVDFGKDSINTGMSFESAMSQIAATLGYTVDDIADNINGAGDNFDALKKKAAEMGRETNFTASQAAEGLNILAMSGFDAQQSISMIADVLHLAAAGSMDMASAAGYISGSMKGFADETKDSAYYADLMAKGATLANTSVSQLGEAMSSGAAGAAAYSQSAESMTVALLRLAEQGVVGSAAGTALAAAMKDLYTPTDQAKKALDDLGVSAYENGKALDFNDVVNELNAALAGFSEEEANAYKQTIFGIQGLNAYNKMTVTGVEAQNNWAAALAGASEGMGEAAKQYDTMTSNLQGSKDMLSSALEGFQNAVYEHLAGPLTEATNLATSALSELTAGFEEGGLRGALESLGTFAAETFSTMWDGLELPPELEGLPVIIDEIKTALSGIGEAFQPLVDSFSGAAAEVIPTVSSALKTFFDAMKDVSVNTLGSLASGAQGLLSAFSTVAGDAIEIASRGISLFIDALRDSGAVSGIIGTIAEGAGRLISAFSGAAVDVMDGVSAAVGSFMDAFDNGVLSDIISKVADGAKNLIAGIMQGRADIIAGIGAGIKNFLDAFAESGVAETIADIAANAAAFFKTIASVTGDLISGVASGIKTFIAGFDNSSAVGIIDDFVSVIGDLFAMFSEGFAGIITSIADAFSGFGDKIAELWNTAGPSLAETGEAFHAFADNVRDSIDRFMAVCQPVAEWIASVLAVGIQMAVENIIRTFGNLWNAAMNVVAFLQETFGAFVDLMHGDVTGAVEGFKAAWENIKEFFGNLGEMLLAPFKTMASVLGDEANKGVAAIKAPFQAAWEWFVNVGTNIVEGIKSGLANAWSGLTSWIDDKVSGLVGGVMGLLGIHSPSTVFAGIGRNMVLGMREGWTDTFGGLESYIGRDVQRLTDTARIGFEDSAIGRSSAAGISSMFAANEGSGRGDPVSINLVLDGDVAATALYDPLRRTAFQKGHGSTGGLQPA